MAQAPLRVKSHLTYRELTQRYRICKNSIEKSRWHLIWLMANPSKPIMVTKAAKTVGFCQRWARTLVRRYNENGENGLIDQRKNNQGNKPVLDEKQKKELKKTVLNDKPSDGGLWTSVKIANWIKEKTGKRPTTRTGLNYLYDLGFTLQQPRTSHSQKATPEEIKQFKKN